jgi:Fic family protein
MKLNYKYRETGKIRDLLQEIEVLRKVINILPILPSIEENMRRKSLLKSAVFSARIEGNKLNLQDILHNRVPQKDIARIEIENINKALKFIYSSKAPKRLTKNLILKLHKFTMQNISSSAGLIRNEQSAIFNQAGIAIYMPPSPPELQDLIQKFIIMANNSKEKAVINAAICHFAFEKIHPFLDGNGRVGRLLSIFISKLKGYDFRGLVSLEEYINSNRQAYYDLLTIQKKDITPFIEFFLESIAFGAERVVNKLKSRKEELPEDRLLPRRREILEIIKDHKIVSFDFIKRRFRRVPDSTLHYDLRQLTKQNFVKKLGETRGALYSSLN